MALPLWATTAGADPVGSISPTSGAAGTAITVTVSSGCVDVGLLEQDVFIVLNTDDPQDEDPDASVQQGFPFAADGIYQFTAPAELAFGAGNTTAGPAYPVGVGCFDEELELGDDPNDAIAVGVVGTFTYTRGATTSTSLGSTTSTSSSSSTTSTTQATSSTTAAPTTTTSSTSGLPQTGSSAWTETRIAALLLGLGLVCWGSARLRARRISS